MIEHICAHCKETFLITGARVNQGEGKYCSVQCKHASAGRVGKILNALPGTFGEIAKKVGVPQKNVQAALSRLMKDGRVHFTGLIETNYPAHNMAKHALNFALGPFPDDWSLPRVIREAVPVMIDKLILDAMPGYQASLSRKTGLCESSLSKIICRLHATKQCHIYRWKRIIRGSAVPCYKVGKGKDVANNVVPYTRKEIMDRWFSRHEKTGKLAEYRARRAAAERTRYKLKNGDTLINALFGSPKERKAA